jgi:hypothetical protein
METVSNQPEVSSQQPSAITSPDLNTQPNQDVNETQQVKSMLAEARNTRDMLVGFRSAIEKGLYNGVNMMDLAKGMAFLEAILKQNNAHIHNLQDRLGESK